METNSLRRPGLPPFAGKCQARHLSEAAHEAADSAVQQAAERRARRSARADGLLPALLGLLMLAMLTHCAPAHHTPARQLRDERAAPLHRHSRYEWRWADEDE